jgi:hypothetical protein
MTGTNDQDRRIAAWFEDVPSRIPDRTIDAVLAHARTHPRRRDPLAALRRDPMGSAGFGLGRMMQPLPLIAAVGLLAAAALAGAAVGGWFRGEPAVGPPVVAPSLAPSASVAPSPATSPATIRVDLIEHLGNDAFINVTDESFTLIGAMSGDPGDGVDVPPDEIRIENDPTDPDTIVLTWSGETCDTSHDLVIGGDGRALALTRPACEGDSLGGVGHVLRLTFDAPAPAAEFDATLVTTP